jgi:pyruvate formate lyase activating enzyme
MQEARLYQKLDGEQVQCDLCEHRCVIAEGDLGVCCVRRNIDGVLYALTYGRLISQHVDPVEKKPLYHFYPGSRTYSIAAAGCNFRCRWCQNWVISQMPREEQAILGEDSSPATVVAEAKRDFCQSIAYTYTEPTMNFEFNYETAKLAHGAGLHNIYVTDGYMSREMLEMFHPYLDAANVDLKSFRKRTYQRYIGSTLQPVLDSLKTMKDLGIWSEVTTLIVPGINDEEAELRDLTDFIATELGVDTPWHISRFFPGYQMTSNIPTPKATLERACEIGKEAGLRYVYVGNVNHAGHSDTHCPYCGEMLILREGYRVSRNAIRDNKCPTCDSHIAGVGLGW